MSASNQKWIQSPYFGSGDPRTEEMTTLYAPGMLGCCGQFDMGGISGPANIGTFQLVLLAAVTLVPGNVLTWSSKPAYTVTNAALNGNTAGIGSLTTSTMGPSTYVWIAKKGIVPVLFIAAPTVAPSTSGLPVVADDATVGKANCLARSQTQAAFPLLGVSVGAVTSDLANVNLNIVDQY